MNTETLATELHLPERRVIDKLRREGFNPVNGSPLPPKWIAVVADAYSTPRAGRSKATVKAAKRLVRELPAIQRGEAIIAKHSEENLDSNQLSDFGSVLFFHPNAKLFYVSLLIVAQAYNVAMLARDVIGINGLLQDFFFWCSGTLFGLAGIVLAKNAHMIFDKYDVSQYANGWLVLIFAFDVAIDWAYYNPSNFGGYVLTFLIPLGILVFSVTYVTVNK